MRILCPGGAELMGKNANIGLSSSIFGSILKQSGRLEVAGRRGGGPTGGKMRVEARRSR